jgi:nucleotide-binding universal stress UspA family protein
MKILVPTAGSVPAKKKAEYIVQIAKRLGANVIALHILRNEEQTEAQKALTIFSEAGRKEEVNVVRVLEKGDIVPTIVTSAEKEGADLIIMGASEGKVVAEWVSAGVMEKTKVPVVVIPHEFKRSASISS